MQTAVTPITVNDAESKSTDIVAENIDRLRRLFPELIMEGEHGTSVNVDVLKQLVGDQTVTDADEKYGLNWHGKREARRLALTPSTGTLRPAPEESVDWDTTQNLMIEGDNLEVLKLLRKSYAGKVKLIYIDPPYNTGKDFVYKDNYQDTIRNYKEITGQVEGGASITSNTETSGRFHTEWLNMMYPRLALARDLLARDGVIFISIDDSEAPRLRSLCDQVFGEENICGVIKRRAARKTAFLSKRMTDMCDYVVAYVKSDMAEPLSAGQISGGTRPVFNEGNGISERILRKGSKAKCNDGTYPPGEYAARTLSFNLIDEVVVKKGIVQEDARIEGPWRINQEVLDSTMFVTRNFGMRRTMMESELGKAKLLNDLLDKSSCYNEKGTEELEDLLGGSVFSNPKPKALITYLAEAASVHDGEIVLDFFAGSGTTGHAVMSQNAADGGSRRFILVQLPEPLDPNDKDQRAAAAFCDELGRPRTIAELTKERLRRAGKKVQEDNPDYEGDLGFRVYKLDDSNLRTWEAKPDDLDGTLYYHIEHIRPDRTEQDVLYELLLKLGLDLCVPIETREMAGKTVYSVGAGVLFVSLPESLSREEAETVATGIASWREELGTEGDTTVVIRDSAFADDVAKANLAAILEQHGIKTVRSL